jgi:O-antigen/teichoic acid export membrane protein
MTFATLNMCGTLYYFVPRSDARRKRLYVHQTLLFIALSGLACGFLVSPANPLLPAPMRPLEQHGLLVPAFVALWVLGSLLDRLPTVDERISWQACATVGVSAMRVLLMAAGAWFTGDLHVMLWLLMAVVLTKVVLLAYYVRRRHGLGRPWFERAAFSEQFRHSAPLGLNAAFFGLRGNADQWVAASLFSLTSFAAFSIAAVVGQLVHILRQSIMEAFLPSMSRMQAAANVRGMLEMNSRGNVIVGKLLYPTLAFVFVFAPELVTMVYTASYSQAAPVMRVYIVGMLASVVEMGSLVMLLRQGNYALGVTAFTLGAVLRSSRRRRGQRARALPRPRAGAAPGGAADRDRAAAPAGLAHARDAPRRCRVLGRRGLGRRRCDSRRTGPARAARRGRRGDRARACARSPAETSATRNQEDPT